MAGGAGTRVECVDRPDRLAALEADWNRLASEAKGTELYATWDWAMACARQLHRDDVLHVVVLWAGNRAVGIAPLVLCRRRGLTIAQFLGHGAADYGDVLVEAGYQAQLAEALAQDLRDRSLILRNVRADSPNRRLFEGLTGVQHIPSEKNPFVALTGPVEVYLGGPRKRIVQDARRQTRRLEELGSVAYSVVTAEQDIPAALDALVAFKSRRTYVRDVAVNPFEDPDNRAFLDDICRAALRRGALRLEILTLNGAPIALHVGFVMAGKYYYYVPAFDAAYARYSPGRLLCQRAIEASFAAGLREFDFLNGEEPYKYDWSTGDRETLTFYRLRPRLLSWGYGAWFGRLKPALRRQQLLFMLVRRLRSGKRR